MVAWTRVVTFFVVNKGKFHKHKETFQNNRICAIRNYINVEPTNETNTESQREPNKSSTEILASL